MSSFTKSASWFAAGTLFGALGLKVLASKDAKKVYVHVTAAGLRAKDEIMNTVTCVQESAADILAEAKDLNAEMAAKEAEAQAAAEILDEADAQVESQVETEI